MEYRVLGTTGVHVSTLCLGAGMFGRFGNTNHAECESMVHAAIDAGINFIDTSDVYSFGGSEEILGRALKGRRHEVVLATKFRFRMGENATVRSGSGRVIVNALSPFRVLRNPVSKAMGSASMAARTSVPLEARSTAPVLEANEEEVSFAVATITLFGLLAVLVYPYAGHLVGLTDRAFGLWAGTAVNDTSQVVAVGSIFSEAALNVATVVKLTRNTLMAPLIVLFGLVYARGFNRDMSDEAAQASSFNWRKVVPGFVIGFLLMSLVRTVGVALLVLPQSVSEPGDLIAAASFLKTCEEISRFAILMALAGVGLNTDLVSLRRIGLKPLLVGTCVAVVLALVSLGLILYTPLGS